MSYSREDAVLQRRIIVELRRRGINVWVDIENLVPGSPTWEREIERSIRTAAGVIVLLSPHSNNSEWVRREISFAEQNARRIFPVLVGGDEQDSIPLRLSDHQWVDLRKEFQGGLDELTQALKDQLDVTVIGRRAAAPIQSASPLITADLKRFALPGLLALGGLACLGGLILAARLVFAAIPAAPTRTAGPLPVALTTAANTEMPVATNSNIAGPAGRIVYTCQVHGDEVCIINADGSGWHQLTDSPTASYNASLSPDGQSVIYVGKGTGDTEIYELTLSTGQTKRLTQLKAELGSPEISPDNKRIAFTYRGKNKTAQIWIMNRDGQNPHKFYGTAGQEAHDPTWSPDGTQILFARGQGDNNKLYILGLDQPEPHLVNNAIDTRGRSDWSIASLLTFDMGGSFQHDVYLMDVDGSNLRKLSNGNNSQGASFSPDGQWIAFTAYTDVGNKDQASCEIYIMRIDGTALRRLTENTYCDYQPRWGK